MIKIYSLLRGNFKGGVFLAGVPAILIALSAPAQVAQVQVPQVKTSHPASPAAVAGQHQASKSAPTGKPASHPGSSTLGFLPPVVYSPGGQAQSAVVADVNGDSKLDIVVAAQNPDEVNVLLGNGDGTFAPAQSYSAGGNTPVFLAVGDVNGDGKLDIVVANECGSGSKCTSANVGVLLGNGDGTFQPAVGYDSGVNTSNVVIKDVNGDGKPDLIAADGSILFVLLGNGDGTFRFGYSSSSGPDNTPNNLAVLDMNGDGKPDVVMGRYSATVECGGTPAIFFGNGDGTFQAPIPLDSEGTCPLAVGIADLNGDGKPDVVVANQCTYDHNCVAASVGVLLGNGDGTFQRTAVYPVGGSAVSLAIADLDDDGRLDVVVSTPSGFGSNINSILLGNGNGTFQPAMLDDRPSGASTVVVGDLNNDGIPDLVMASGGTVDVLIGANAGMISTTTIMTPSVNPVLAGHAITYTVTMTSQDGSEVSGYVDIYDPGSGFFCDGSLVDNQFLCTGGYRDRQAGTHTLTANYEGDSSHWGSLSPPLTEYVQFHSTTRVATLGSPSHAGQPVTFTATVTSSKGKIPNGESVNFYDKKTLLGSAPLSNSNASITTSSLSVKKHTIEAIYPGDNQFGLSHGSVIQVVEP